jgi:hypothetical protein
MRCGRQIPHVYANLGVSDRAAVIAAAYEARADRVGSPPAVAGARFPPMAMGL